MRGKEWEVVTIGQKKEGSPPTVAGGEGVGGHAGRGNGFGNTCGMNLN